MASYQDSATSTATGANGVTYSYRRMGTSKSAQPLVLLQHFRGNLDNWDPALIDALAAERAVIAFDNVGVGATTGQVPASVTQMAHGAIAFISAGASPTSVCWSG
jgi:pimeloyl-ACP methyl ester carboxylesterase